MDPATANVVALVLIVCALAFSWRIVFLMNMALRVKEAIMTTNAIESQQNLYDFWVPRFQIYERGMHRGNLFAFWRWTRRQIWGEHQFPYGDWLTPQLPKADVLPFPTHKTLQ